MSIVGDYGECEILQAIEGFGIEVHRASSFSHYERLGIGHAVKMQHQNVQLHHEKLYFFNLKLTNWINYTDIVSSK